MKIRKDCDSGYNITTSLFEVSIGVSWQSWAVPLYISWFGWHIFSIILGPCYAVFHVWRKNR